MERDLKFYTMERDRYKEMKLVKNTNKTNQNLNLKQ